MCMCTNLSPLIYGHVWDKSGHKNQLQPRWVNYMLIISHRHVSKLFYEKAKIILMVWANWIYSFCVWWKNDEPGWEQL